MNSAGVGGYFFGGGAIKIKSIQTGVISIANASASNTATVTSVDTANTVAMHLGASHASADATIQDAVAYLVITNATTLTVTRASTTNATVVSYATEELNPGLLKSLQTGLITVSGSATQTATITSVDITRTSLIWGGYSCTQTRDDLSFGKIVQTSATVLTASFGSNPGTGVVPYQAREWAA